MALGSQVASPMLDHFTPEKALVHILQEAKWIPGPVWRQKSEEKSSSLHRLELNPHCPASSQAPGPQQIVLKKFLNENFDQSVFLPSSSGLSCKLRHQGCSSAQRQVFHCKLGAKFAVLLGTNRCSSYLLLYIPHFLFSI